MSDKWEREARELAEANGVPVRKMDQGILYGFPKTDPKFMVSLPTKSPGDYRTWRNIRSQIRRAIVRTGGTVDGHEESDVQEATNEKALGLYITRRKKITTIEENEQEATIDLPTLAKLVGLEIPADSEVSVLDADGTMVTLPFTITTKTTTTSTK